MRPTTDAIDALVRLGADPDGGVYLRPPATEAAIDRMQAEARTALGGPVPAGYLDLLRRTDGVQVNGAYFTSAGGLVAENLDVPYPGVVVLGHAGNVDEFLFDLDDGRLHTVVMGSPRDRLASFESFGDLLASVLRDQDVV